MHLIPLTKGKAAMIDDEDVATITKHSWHFKDNGYAMRSTERNGEKKSFYMHRELLNAPKGMAVDHINHDKLDNRRSNLRLCTIGQNNRNMRMNKHGFKGVSWDTARGRFKATISVNNKSMNIGRFDTAEEAALYYDVAAQLFYGQYAYLNNV